MIDWNTISPLTSLTHLDGRNASKLSSLKPYFSEFAWMKERLRVMIGYAIALASSHGVTLTLSRQRQCKSLHASFSLRDAQEVVTIERTVNHDVKALELYLISRLKRRGLLRLIPYINLGIGSEDINSMAFVLLMVGSRDDVMIPAIRKMAKQLIELAFTHRATAMVARTHAQPANITTFGKEIANTLSRLCDEMELFQSMKFQAKCSGEAGTYQAFMGMDQSFDAMDYCNRFIRTLGLIPSPVSTQIAPYDSPVRFLQSLYRINIILLDLCKNMWLYVLLGYLNVRTIESEVGSAGMPHKVNPIYFEGAEGGLEMANGTIELFVRKLPVNRLQRDFSDSTMRRNIVLPIAYSLLSYQSIVEALNRIEVDTDAIENDLVRHAEVWTETVKTYGTTHGIVDMYDRLKKATRGKILSQKDLQMFIATLPLNEKEQQELRSLCDGKHNPYPGKIVEDVVKRARNVFL